MTSIFFNQHHAFLLANNPASSVQTLRELASSRLPILRARTAENPACPVDVLRRLSGDIVADVRIGVARNVNSTDEILAILSDDENPDVRFALAENPLLSLAVLRKLTRDENPYVSHRAQKSIAMREYDAVCKSAKHILLPLCVTVNEAICS